MENKIKNSCGKRGCRIIVLPKDKEIIQIKNNKNKLAA